MVNLYRSDALFRAEMPTKCQRTLRTLPVYKKRMGHFQKRVTALKGTTLLRDKTARESAGNCLRLFDL